MKSAKKLPDLSWVDSLKLTAKSLIDEGEIKSAKDVSHHFSPLEIAAIAEFLVEEISKME
jgi:hypothetical protein